jgi:hypothetical protein
MTITHVDEVEMEKTPSNWSVRQTKDNGFVDKRFGKVFRDPRFRKPPIQRSKIVIDKRFKNIFTDKRFSSSSKNHALCLNLFDVKCTFRFGG